MTEDQGPQPPDRPGHEAGGPAEGAPQLPPPPAYPPAYPAPGTGPYAGYAAAQPGYPPQPGLAGYPAYVVPDHPKATTALVLGIIAVAGFFTCVLPVVIAPFAWALGARARKDIRLAPQQWGGDGRATAGMVLGIIGTVLLVLVVVVVALFLIVALSDPTVFNDGGNTRV